MDWEAPWVVQGRAKGSGAGAQGKVKADSGRAGGQGGGGLRLKGAVRASARRSCAQGCGLFGAHWGAGARIFDLIIW